MLLSLVYVSSAREVFRPEDLAELLQHSRRNNARAGITGLLLYVGGNFMQALEGADDAVDELYDRISRDQRHTGVQLIVRLPIERRLYPDWAMAFHSAEDLPSDIRDGISTFLDESANLGSYAPPHQELPPTLALLRRFAATMR
ncbi:MAG TPA: BLUF domain-containing protein [Stellaceae bacterium]|jgi:hypothetical protein|nr:BLUF domain-containing protein [Stellaceae bacterium]